MTPSGWMTPPPRCWGSSADGCWPSRSVLLFAVREAADERLFPGLPDADPRGAHRRGRPGAAHRRRPRSSGRAGSRPARRRDPGQPAGAAGAGQRDERGRAGRRLRRAAHGHRCPGSSRTTTCGGCRPCPEPTQRLMLLAAADPTGDATLLWRAAPHAGPRTGRGGRGRRGAAARDRLPGAVPASPGAVGRLRGRVPAGSPRRPPGARRRRRMPTPIRSAGCGTWPPRPPDRTRTSPPQLERAAGRVQARAGLAAAAAFLQRSVALTAEPGRRAERALAAAHAYLHAGAFDAALGLLAEAEADAVDDLQRARVEQLRGQIERASGSGREAPVRLLRAASEARVTRSAARPGDLPSRLVGVPRRRSSRTNPAAGCSRSPGRHDRPRRRRTAPRPA